MKENLAFSNRHFGLAYIMDKNTSCKVLETILQSQLNVLVQLLPSTQ